MTVRVEQMTNEITAAGDLPLTEAQIAKLLEIVLRRLAEQERNDRYSRETTALRRRVAPGAPIEK